MKKPKSEPKTTEEPRAESAAKATAAAETTAAESREAEAGSPAQNDTAQDLEAKAAKADEHWDRLLRTTAEFDNFRKRAAREKDEAVRYANQKLMERLLPVLDSFDMAVTAASAQNGDTTASLREGIQLVLQQFKTVLTEAGLEEIDAHGKPFDPNLHEAVSQMETDEVEEGHVAQQLRKGYRLRDRLVRPSSVVVARKPA